MKKLLNLSLIILALGCSKDDNSTQTLPQETPVDVYIGGSYGLSPAIWKNGESPSLITTTGTSITISSMFIEGNDQYLVGSEMVAGKRLATIWKNGVPTRLHTDFYEGQLTDIIVKNGTTHCVGYFYETATSKPRIMYLINESGVFVTSGANYAYSKKMFIKDDVVYIAGNETTSPTDNTDRAKYWRNGVSIPLSSGTTDHYANDIFVDSNNDVHICGSSYNAGFIPKYWKNGVETLLETPDKGHTSAILKVNNDVFIVGGVSNFGSSNSKACYWKNGIRTDLPNTATYSSASDITTNQGNIYILGSIGGNGAAYWKNGEIVNLTIPGLFATLVNSIFVK